uniref:Uncharacterized protein n=1 Tax=Setaria digitata TaxID=48799 RepID=A0A915Q4Q4_9BILA
MEEGDNSGDKKSKRIQRGRFQPIPSKGSFTHAPPPSPPPPPLPISPSSRSTAFANL